MSKAAEKRRQQIKTESELAEAFRAKFSEVHRQGLTRGAYAICQAVLQMIQDNEGDPEKALNTIAAFCKTAENPTAPTKENTDEV